MIFVVFFGLAWKWVDQGFVNSDHGVGRLNFFGYCISEVSSFLLIPCLAAFVPNWAFLGLLLVPS